MVMSEKAVQAEYAGLPTPESEDEIVFNPAVGLVDFELVYNRSTGQLSFLGSFDQIKEQVIGLLTSDIRLREDADYFKIDVGLANEIATKVLDTHLKKYVKNGGLDVGAMLGFKKSEAELLKEAGIKPEDISGDERKEKLREYLLDYSNRMAFMALQGHIYKNIEHGAVSPQTDAQYMEFLDTKVGDHSIKEIIKMTSSDSSNRQIYGRDGGFGSYAFAYAQSVGMEKELKQEWMVRAKEIYESMLAKPSGYNTKTGSIILPKNEEKFSAVDLTYDSTQFRRPDPSGSCACATEFTSITRCAAAGA